jgi:hypothetical protein
MTSNFFYEAVNCKNCGKAFLKRDRPHRGTTKGKLRPSNVLTCCHKCSVEFTHKKRRTYKRK